MKTSVPYQSSKSLSVSVDFSYVVVANEHNPFSSLAVYLGVSLLRLCTVPMSFKPGDLCMRTQLSAFSHTHCLTNMMDAG